MPRITPRRASGVILAIAAIAAGGTAYADSPDGAHGAPAHTNTIRLLEASETIKPAIVDTGAPGVSAGDMVVIRDGVLRPDHSPAGTLNQVCILVKPAGNPFTSQYECSGSIALAEGTLTMQGPFDPTQDEQVAAVTGGSGAFATARGEIAIRSEADELVVTLAR